MSWVQSRVLFPEMVVPIAPGFILDVINDCISISKDRQGESYFLVSLTFSDLYCWLWEIIYLINGYDD